MRTRFDWTSSLFWLASFECFSTIIWLFASPSEEENAFILGISKVRIVMVGAMLLASLGIAILAIIYTKNNKLRSNWNTKIDQWMIDQGYLTRAGIPIALFALAILLISIRILSIPVANYSQYESWAPKTFPLLHSVINRILPIITCGILISSELIIAIFVRYRKHLADKQLWKLSYIAQAISIFIIGIATILQWGIFIFQLRIFQNIPGWYWDLNYKPFSSRDIILVSLLLVLIPLTIWSFKSSRGIAVQLFLIYLFGIGLQIGMGYVEGNGIDSLRQKFFSRYHATYAVKASENNLNLVDNIRNYEDIYGESMFTSTKPPGLMAFYISMERLVNGAQPELTTEIRYERLQTAITWSFPFISFLIIFVMGYVTSKIMKLENGLLTGKVASLLFVLAPNVILIALFMDQAIYPLLFILLSTFIIYTFRRKSIILALLLGLIIYIALFFTFTVLPLVIFIGIFGIIEYFASQRKNETILHRILLFGLIGAGFISACLFFRYALNYDFFSRLFKTMALNRNVDFYVRIGLQPPENPITLIERISQSIRATRLNIIEIAVTVGIPVFGLFVVQAFRVIADFFKKQFSQATIIQGSIMLTFFILALAGTTQGEVGRLWLFWVPFIAIFAALEIQRSVKEKYWPGLVIVLAQFITVIITYHFQDLQM